jgi:hypothetical protein
MVQGLVARIVSMDSWVWTTVMRGKDGNSIPVILGPYSHHEFLASNSQPRVSIWSLVPRGIAHDSFSMLLERISFDFLEMTQTIKRAMSTLGLRWDGTPCKTVSVNSSDIGI